MIRILEPEVMDTAQEALEYEAMDHGQANQSFVERLLHLGVTSGHALDIGTGPGHIPVLAAERAPALSITAIDLAEEMLALARRRVEAAGLSDRITVRNGDAKRLPFGDGMFDVVFSNTILHHIEEPVHFLAEARRVLKLGGARIWKSSDRHLTLEIPRMRS